MGIYIDSMGDVYYFNGTQQIDDTIWEIIHRYFRSDLRGKPPYTTSQLFKHYRNTSEYITTIPPEELKEMIALLDKAQYGKFESCDHSTRDWGLLSFDGFTFDSKWNNHELVTLGYWGDMCGYNSTSESQTLTKWLSPLYSEIMTKYGQPTIGIFWN